MGQVLRGVHDTLLRHRGCMGVLYICSLWSVVVSRWQNASSSGYCRANQGEFQLSCLQSCCQQLKVVDLTYRPSKFRPLRRPSKEWCGTHVDVSMGHQHKVLPNLHELREGQIVGHSPSLELVALSGSNVNEC